MLTVPGARFVLPFSRWDLAKSGYYAKFDTYGLVDLAAASLRIWIDAAKLVGCPKSLLNKVGVGRLR